MKKVLIFSWCGVPILFIQACQNLLKQPALNCLDCLAYDWNESNFFNSLGALGFVPFRQNLAYIYNKWAISSLGLQLQNCLLCSYSDERFFCMCFGLESYGLLRLQGACRSHLYWVPSLSTRKGLWTEKHGPGPQME